MVIHLWAVKKEAKNQTSTSKTHDRHQICTAYLFFYLQSNGKLFMIWVVASFHWGVLSLNLWVELILCIFDQGIYRPCVDEGGTAVGWKWWFSSSFLTEWFGLLLCQKFMSPITMGIEKGNSGIKTLKRKKVALAPKIVHSIHSDVFFQ